MPLGRFPGTAAAAPRRRGGRVIAVCRAAVDGAIFAETNPRRESAAVDTLFDRAGERSPALPRPGAVFDFVLRGARVAWPEVERDAALLDPYSGGFNRFFGDAKGGCGAAIRAIGKGARRPVGDCKGKTA